MSAANYKDIFKKLRGIVTKSETDLKNSKALLDKMKPSHVDDATH